MNNESDCATSQAQHIEAWTWFDAAGEYHLSRDEPGDGDEVYQLTALVAAHPSSAEPEGKEAAQPMGVEGPAAQMLAETRKALQQAADAPGKAVSLPPAVRTEWAKFMADEPSLFDELPFGVVKSLGATQHEAAPKVEPVATVRAYPLFEGDTLGQAIAFHRHVPNDTSLYTTPHNLDGLLREALAALEGITKLDEENHQRGGDDDDICPEVVAAYDAIAALRQQVGGAG